METSGAEAIEAAAEPTEAETIIQIQIIQIVVNNKIKTKTKVIQNLTNEDLAMLMGPQIAPAVAIGPKVDPRPTARTRWSAVGPTSLPQDLRIIIIEKSAC